MNSTWFTFGKDHYNTAVMWSFAWIDGWVTVTLINGETIELFDPDRKLYERMCDGLYVRAVQK